MTSGTFLVPTKRTVSIIYVLPFDSYLLYAWMFVQHHQGELVCQFFEKPTANTTVLVKELSFIFKQLVHS